VLFHHPGELILSAPVVVLLTGQPILRNLPADSNMTKALLLGIALASNIGGAASPIASPQNLIALQHMNPEPSWGVWFFVALPVCIISILLIWGLLVLTFNPGRGTTIMPIRPMTDRFTGVQWFITIVTLITIMLWCVSHQLEHIFGDMGVVAIIPIVLFFGTGILTKEDFNNFLWTIIILAAGGLALGKAVNSSGLLHTIAESITAQVEGMSLYGVLLVFVGLILVIATFISHTVAALIVLPLVQQVGQSMAEPHPNLLVMGAVLMASGAMGLPTSGFPNMSKFTQTYADTSQLTNISCYHDGRPANRTAISRCEALPHARCPSFYCYLCCHCYSWLRADACRWFLSGSLSVDRSCFTMFKSCMLRQEYRAANRSRSFIV
jgi:phosphate transporter